MSNNPFSFDYFKQEVGFYGEISPTTVGDISFDMIPLHGRLRDYFNRNWYETDFKVPRLKIAGKTWMSITPMEVQSAYIPLQMAAYDVWTAGLGLGYFALKAAAKEEVNRVIVYEQEPKIIEFFYQAFGNRPELDKIEIRQGDFLEALRGTEIDQNDFIFNDIYPTLNDPDMIEHYKEFGPEYPGYTFWGAERVILDASMTFEKRPAFIYPIIREFVRMWYDISVGEAVGDPSLNDVPLHQMYHRNIWREAQVDEFLEVYNYQ
jgi:hypothetical protein